MKQLLLLALGFLLPTALIFGQTPDACPDGGTATPFTLDIAGLASWDFQGDSDNDSGTLTTPEGTVVAVGWDVTIAPVSPSWLQEATLTITGDGGSATLNPGDGFQNSSTQNFSSGGPVNVTNFPTLPGGGVAWELHEINYDDHTNGIDANYLSGSQYTIYVCPAEEPAEPCSELFISEYAEGSSFNKCIEIYNPTDAAVDLSDYELKFYFGGNTSAGNTIALSGMLASGDVYVVCDDAFDTATYGDIADLYASGSFYNGDDAVSLEKDGVPVDVVGEIGDDPGSQWSVGADGTQNHTIRRMSSVSGPTTTWFGEGEDQWDTYASNTFDGFGIHESNDCAAPPVAEGCSELFISEYAEGSSNNKCIEIYNPSGGTIDLSDYQLRFYFGGNTSAGTTINLSGMLASGDVHVVCDDGFDTSTYGDIADQTSGSSFYNGDDAVSLEKDGVPIDVVGEIGDDPGSQWTVGADGTQNHTIRRLPSVTEPTTTWFGEGEDQWETFASNTFDGFGFHVSECIEQPECSIVNVILTEAPACGDVPYQDDSYFDISFTVSGGSGTYNIINPANNVLYNVESGAATDGTVMSSGQANVGGNMPGGVYQVVVRDAMNPSCQSEPIEITVPECPLDPTELCMGDIALSGFQSDNPDILAFYLFKDVGPGTEITFTDNGWYAAGGFRPGEGELTVFLNISLPCGTAIAVEGNTVVDGFGNIVGTASVDGFALSASGDQIFAYQGYLENGEPNFLAALNFDGSDWAADATSSNTSALPCVFQEGVTSLAVPEADNGTFECQDFETSYTASEMRAMIYDAANWTTSSSPIFSYPADCYIQCEECEYPEINYVLQSTENEYICPGEQVGLSVNGELGDASEWVWYTECCGGGEVVGTGSSLFVYPEETTTYYVRGEGGCVDAAKCVSTEVTIIVDEERPTISCGGLDMEVVAPEGSCEATVDLNVPEADDNCGVASLKWRFRELVDGVPGAWSGWMNDPVGQTFAVGAYEIQWRVRDEAGNQRRCKYDLVVLDEEDPMIECTDITVVFNGEEVIFWDVEDVASASDNCGIESLTIDLYYAKCDQIDEVLSVKAVATDVNGNTADCVAYVTVDGLPCGWRTEEGMVDCSGEADYTAATQTFILSSEDCHNPVTDEDDEFAFIQTTLCGNSSITAQVTSITGNDLGWAGITMRNDNDPTSASVTLMTNLGQNHRTELRLTDGGDVTAGLSPSFNRHWLRLERMGNNIRGFVSFNGLSWFSKFNVYVPMDYCVEVGMVVNGYTSDSDITATFNNVSVTGGAVMPTIQAMEQENQLNEQGAERDRSLNLSVANGSELKDFSAYPNPTAGWVTLNLGDFMDQEARLSIMDEYGRDVEQRELGVIDNGTMRLDLSRYAAGVYTLQLQLPNGEVRQQRVVLLPRP